MEHASVLAEADSLINGDRQGDYGHPIDNCGRIAVLWTAHLRARGLLVDGAELTEEDTVWMMIDLKKSREWNRPKRDNKVDAAGYVGMLELIHDERERRAS